MNTDTERNALPMQVAKKNEGKHSKLSKVLGYIGLLRIDLPASQIANKKSIKDVKPNCALDDNPWIDE